MIPDRSSTTARRRPREFTGWHALAILVAFFGVVITVNLIMARDAITTFGGLVVENSYVASQHFNRWLDEAAAEKALGWKATTSRNAAGALVVKLTDKAGKPLKGENARVFAVHPLGRKPPVDMPLHEISPGNYDAPLPAGRWYLRVVVEVNGRTWRSAGEVH